MIGNIKLSVQNSHCRIVALGDKVAALFHIVSSKKKAEKLKQVLDRIVTRGC